MILELVVVRQGGMAGKSTRCGTKRGLSQISRQKLLGMSQIAFSIQRMFIR